MARPDAEFTAPHNIEYLGLNAFNKEKLTGTIFLEIAAAACTLGHKNCETFGELTNALGITQYDAHQVGCACNGETVTGTEVARRLRALMT